MMLKIIHCKKGWWDFSGDSTTTIEHSFGAKPASSYTCRHLIVQNVSHCFLPLFLLRLVIPAGYHGELKKKLCKNVDFFMPCNAISPYLGIGHLFT